MSAKPISRRRFLKTGCITVAAAGLTVCGVSAVAPDPPPIDLSSFTYGEKTMNKRVLVAYASATAPAAFPWTSSPSKKTRRSQATRPC
jgi:hypothetical protein